MSTDAEYLLVYDSVYDEKDHPRHGDIQYLKEKYGGIFIQLGCSTVYWDKPKHRLYEEIEYLKAEQILERIQCEFWTIIKE